MRQLADRQNIAADELPTLTATTEHAGDAAPQIEYLHTYADSTFLPTVGDRLFFGKIGRAGIGSRMASAELLAVYALASDHLEPAAGFYLDTVGQILSTVRVSETH